MPLKVEDYLIDRCKDYLSVPSLKKLPSIYVNRFSEKSEELNLVKKNSAWINFQGKYEYNPLHHHGGFLSYVIWYRYRQVPGRKYWLPRADSRGAHVCVLRSLAMVKMDPSAADMALAMWNGDVQDARKHARQ